MAACQRILRGAPGVLEWQAADQYGEPADPGIVTATVTRADGTVAGTADRATVGDGTAPRSITLFPVHTLDVDRFTIEWSVDAVVYGHTTAEVVGGFYCSLAEIRGVEPSLSNSYDDTRATLLRCRDEVESMFESATGVSWVPRFAKLGYDCGVARGYDIRRLLYAQTVDSLGVVTDVDLDGSIVAPAGVRLPYTPYGTTTVGVEYGRDAPPPDLKRAAILAIRHQANAAKSAIDPRATTFQMTEGGTVMLATPGIGPWVTGIPTVDETLKRWRRPAAVRTLWPVAGLASHG